jgi:ribosomal-protein-alanine N-acetyltransferase
MHKDFFLKGTSIYLRTLSEQDVQGNYIKWLNDPEVTLFNSHGRFPMTVDKLKDYVKRVNSDTNALVLAVVDLKSNKHIGNISLQNINWVDRNAEIAFLLGEKSFWGRGIMMEAGKLLIQHAFHFLNLHRIYCGTSSENIGMQKLALKLGMSKEGNRVEAIFKNGQYCNIFEYGLTSQPLSPKI